MNLRAYMRAAAAAYPQRALVETALALIERQAPIERQGKAYATGRLYQIVALRRYLRIPPGKLRRNWSWSEVEVQQKKGEEPARTLYEQADLAALAFARANPGYHLNVTPVRSFERQVTLWLRNTAIGALGQRLLRDAEKELAAEVYPDAPTDTSVRSFSAWLSGYRLRKDEEPSNAVPGTSDHGRGMAVDFEIKRGNVVVAGIERARIDVQWEAPGWTGKLSQACKDTRLHGPLPKPYEPWHWVLGGAK